MKKILQISNYYYPNIGGIEQVARDISNALKDEPEIEQKVICFNEDSSDGDHVCRRRETIHEIIDGIEVIKCGCFTKVASQSLSLTFGRELKKLMSDYEPNIIIFHYPNPFQAFYLLKYKRKDFKLVLYWHLDIVKQKILGKLFYGQTTRLLKQASIVIATSPLYIEGSSFLNRFKHKCLVIPNCINEIRLAVNDSIRMRAEQIRKENKGKIICFGVGRHIEYKGFEYLIQASKLLDKRFRVFIGGTGPLTDDLKKEAADDSKIIFLGRVSDDDLIAYYKAMDIFCFPSITKNEAFGIALAEGMYFGKPAVTFTIPGSGVNYVNIKDVTGLEVPNCDSKAFAEALIHLADDENLRKELGEAAKQRVYENFLGVQFRRDIADLINKL